MSNPFSQPGMFERLTVAFESPNAVPGPFSQSTSEYYTSRGVPLKLPSTLAPTGGPGSLHSIFESLITTPGALTSMHPIVLAAITVFGVEIVDGPVYCVSCVPGGTPVFASLGNSPDAGGAAPGWLAGGAPRREG